MSEEQINAIAPLDALPPLESPRAKNGKRKITAKQKKFAKHYAKTLNATESAMVSYDTDDRTVAQNIGSENLSKPIVRQEIEALLRSNEINIPEILSIHRRNMLQTKHLPTSQKAVEGFEDMLGLTVKEKPTNEVKIAFIIEK